MSLGKERGGFFRRKASRVKEQKFRGKVIEKVNQGDNEDQYQVISERTERDI